MKQLLIVWHSQFGGTAQMAQAARDGALEAGRRRRALPARAGRRRRRSARVRRAARRDVRELRLACRHDQGFLRARVLSLRARVEGKPYTVIVCAGTDGSGAMFQTDRIATGLSLRKVLPGIVCKSGVTAKPQVVPRDVLDAMPASSARRSRPGMAAGSFPVGCYVRALHQKCESLSFAYACGTPPRPRYASPAAVVRASPRIASTDLFGGAREIVIEHGGRYYRLRITQNGKLILTA